MGNIGKMTSRDVEQRHHIRFLSTFQDMFKISAGFGKFIKKNYKKKCKV